MFNDRKYLLIIDRPGAIGRSGGLDFHPCCFSFELLGSICFMGLVICDLEAMARALLEKRGEERLRTAPKKIFPNAKNAGFIDYF